MTNMSIQPLWLTYFIEILLVLELQLTKTYFGTFSYKAHFRPQISSNPRIKQDPWAWYSRIDIYLQILGFSMSDVDPNLYFKVVKNQLLILVLYVDDLFVNGDKKFISWCKREITFEFNMKDLGLMHYYDRPWDLAKKIWHISVSMEVHCWHIT